MDYACQAQPFVDVPAKDTIDLQTMDYSYQAQPFVRNPLTVGEVVVYAVTADVSSEALVPALAASLPATTGDSSGEALVPTPLGVLPV